ncbi:hypothetical protein EHQ52_16875 [Leptospira koniambonensis]|uniref:Outer membrane protein beta-barrel domain-containing protein n=1 Tax=Leptospira koniambonensis TaxID=2484950 RepID=A0A4R9J3I5_9LEPT|nr:hypothetical protein [Leptospira koniambonensis]TGL31599.1 hypothetical protein EHQ52_16875 [Leptospira koniambonensis]
MKRLLLGIAICIPTMQIMAKDTSKDVSQNTSWVLKLGAGRGEVRNENFDYGTSSAYRISAEYNPSYFGLELGATNANYSIKKMEEWNKNIALIFSEGQPIPYFQYLNFGKATDKGEFVKMNFLDIGPTFHFRPGKTLDPYVSIGVGIGSSDAKSYRSFGRLGLRTNFERAFLFLEAEASNIHRYISGTDLAYQDYSAWFGIGSYLGTIESKEESPRDSARSDKLEAFAFR